MNVFLGILFFILGSTGVFLYQRRKYKTKTETDFVCEVVQKAFEREKQSDHKEHELVRRLLKSESFIKDLSLTAKYKGMIVGYALFTKIKVGDETLLALAPLAVLPKFQKKGIGKSLVEKGHETAKKLGYKGVVVLGHPEYYSKLGYEKASKWGIKPPFEVPDEVFMAIELKEGALEKVSGIVEYPKEFKI